jgi:hypothetical protein
MEEETVGTQSASSTENTVDKELYDRLYDENRTLIEELERVRDEMALREDMEKGRVHLEELVGSKTGALYDRAVKKAEIEELAALPYEKRYELGYLLCLGEDAHRNRKRTGSVNPPPRFAYSAGNSQVALSAEKRPTTFAAAKENAKRYLNLK